MFISNSPNYKLGKMCSQKHVINVPNSEQMQRSSYKAEFTSCFETLKTLEYKNTVLYFTLKL